MSIALSKEQAAALTADIVWMVEERIQLADGSSTTALTPRRVNLAAIFAAAHGSTGGISSVACEFGVRSCIITFLYASLSSWHVPLESNWPEGFIM